MKNKNLKCSASSCDRDAFCKGLCTKHYQQKRFRGELIEKDYVFIEGICKIIGCGKSILAKGLCQQHYVEGRASNSKND